MKMAKKAKKTKIGVDKAQGKDKSVVASMSPVPTKKIEVFNFYDALREVSVGKRITRVAWNDHNTFVFMKDEFLMIHIGGADHQLIVSRGDMEGIDWYNLPEVN